MNRTIEIIPIDPLFFRDGRPFTMGEETVGIGMSLPRPSTIYGALRAAYYSHSNISLEELESKTKSLVIDSINFYNKQTNSFYLPTPLDIGVDKNIVGKGFPKYDLKLSKDSSFTKNLKEKKLKENSFRFLEFSELTMKSPANTLMNYNDFLTYLEEDKEKEYKLKDISDLVLNENKIGIGRNKIQHSSEEGKLYRIGMNRFQTWEDENPISFIVNIKEPEGLKLPNSGMIKLGGESKTAYFRNIDNDHFKDHTLIQIEQETKYFKIILSTPAIFEKGSIPGQKLQSKFDEIRFSPNLIGMCVGKPVFIGGFDMNQKKDNRKPRTMHKAIPAGSVFFFESKNIPQDLAKKFEDTSISDYEPEKGFGLCYIGNFDEKRLK